MNKIKIENLTVGDIITIKTPHYEAQIQVLALCGLLVAISKRCIIKGSYIAPEEYKKLNHLNEWLTELDLNESLESYEISII